MVFQTEIATLFDGYGRQARLFPGLLTIFPPLLAVLAWFPWFMLSNFAISLLTLAMSCGLLYALGSYARTKGKRIEPHLLHSWGGWPTTLLLRHDSDLDRYTRQRYHSYLARSVPGVPVFPTADMEREASAEANAIYDSAVRWLKEKTRSKDFAMVHRENAQYGFRRNLLGLKPFAIFVCLLALATMAAAVVCRNPSLLDMVMTLNYPAITAVVGSLGPAIIAAFGVNAISMVIWIFLVNKKWVREAGFQYAYALLAACDQIELKQA